MKTIVIDEYLQDKYRLVGNGYRLGAINRKGASEAPFWVKEGTLAGRFEGVRTFLDFINSGVEYGNRPDKSSYDSSHDSERGSKWVRYGTYKEAMQAMTKEPQVFREYNEAEIQLKDYEAPSGFATDFDVTGDFIDIGRVVEGQPESWGTMRNGSIVSKFANIVVAGMSSAGISRTEIDERSSKVLRLVDMLEANNVRCMVTVLYSNDNWHCEVVVKQYNEKLDIDDVAVATSADFFRRGQFLFAEHSKTKVSNYGRAESIRVSQLKDSDADLTVVVSNNYSRSVPYWDERRKGWQAQFEDLEEHLLEHGIEHGDTADLLNEGLVYNGTQIRK